MNSEARTVRMPRDQHALPGRQGAIEVRPDRIEPALQRLDFALARVGARQQLQRLNLLQENGKRLLEL